MAAYVDYTYYTDTYLGTAIASSDFAALALRASAHLDRISNNRVAEVVEADSDADTIDLIKMATCAMAEELKTQQSQGSDNPVQSESVGSYSVTYAKGAYATKSNIRKLQETAALYLGSSGLLFRGFYSGELVGIPYADE